MEMSDVDILEGLVEVDEDTYFKTIQRAINEGSAWRFQGSYGRAMMSSIESGRCMLGLTSFEDAYGNLIPSRSDIQPGSKGSREFVVAAFGEAWVKSLDSAASVDPN